MIMNKKWLFGLLLLCAIPMTVHAETTEQILERLRSMRILWDRPYPENDTDHESLQKANDNYLGWLSFHFETDNPDHTIAIEEPVVFETEPDYYLKHDFYDRPDPNGCIFMDMDSNPSLYGYNDFLYAHHAEDGSLFGTLHHIYEADQDGYLQTHPQYLYLYTETACHKYVLVGYERVEDSNNHYAYTTCENEQMYLEYVSYLKQLPNYIDSKEVNWDCNPAILNFSTCDGQPGTSRRLVLHFAKIMAYAN